MVIGIFTGKPYESTALVTKVARGSSAEASGLRTGDRIVAINQKPVKSMTFLEVSNFLRSGRLVLSIRCVAFTDCLRNIITLSIICTARWEL